MQQKGEIFKGTAVWIENHGLEERRVRLLSFRWIERRERSGPWLSHLSSSDSLVRQSSFWREEMVPTPAYSWRSPLRVAFMGSIWLGPTRSTYNKLWFIYRLIYYYQFIHLKSYNKLYSDTPDLTLTRFSISFKDDDKFKILTINKSF